MGSFVSKKTKHDTEEKTNNKKDGEKTTSKSRQPQEANKDAKTVETNVYVTERQNTFIHNDDGSTTQVTKDTTTCTSMTTNLN